MHRLTLFGFVIIFLCLDHGWSFQTDPLGSGQQLTEELRSLVGETIFGYDQLLLTWCQKQNPENISLDLSNLGIRRIPKNFISSPHVTCLDLQNNNFEETLDFNIFRKVPNLEYLNLAKSGLNLQFSLKDASHTRIKTLILDNSYNYVDYDNYSPNKVLHFHLPNLENLSLRNLNPDRSSYYFWYFDFSSTKLTHLFLSNNDIEQMNDEIFKTFPATLTHLFLERCNLKSYTASVASNNTASLISLSMDGNQFSCANGGCLDFESHPELQYLSMSNCEISVISHNTFFSNSKLVYLDISGNKIQQLYDRVFLKTPALESLNLNDNQLLKIPNLHSLKSLKKLYVKGNKITHVDQDSFSSLENLKILSLSNNNIEFIDGSAFDNLLSLMVLDLSSNLISNLEYNASFNLEYLILSNNTISSVEDIELSNTTLKYLVLTDNPIISIKPKSLKFLLDDTTIVIQKPSSAP